MDFKVEYSIGGVRRKIARRAVCVGDVSFCVDREGIRRRKIGGGKRQIEEGD